jgi:hypothetical protein
MNQIETDYLIIGAGAAGMAFADEILAATDATITFVDRRSTPGGHWNDAYPYVRLHQPSTLYGVTSVPLGQDRIDTTGSNRGFYELAGVDEIRAYFQKVMDSHFLPTGRVRFFPNCEYHGDKTFTSRLHGARWQAKVNKRVVDARYLEGEIPATSPPPYEVGPGVRSIAVGELTNVQDPPERFVIVGGGKTALDGIVWLLEQGVPADKIRWIKPREGWWLDRRFQQPLDLLPHYYRGIALQIEALAQAESIADLLSRLERDGVFLRVDPDFDATMFKGAIISQAELELLRQVKDVIRLGHVKAITATEIVLDEGKIGTSAKTLHVHCASRALATPPRIPIFQPDVITLQPFAWSFICYQHATVGRIEASLENDEEKNALCQSIHYWNKPADYLRAFRAVLMGDHVRSRHPALKDWIRSTRLNPASGAHKHRNHPDVIEAQATIKKWAAKAIENAGRMVGQTPSA